MTLETDASQLGYQDVRDYLRAHGWTQASSKRDYVAIYRHDAPRAEVLIPLDRDLADYGKAMWLAAREIATVERRTVESVLHDLRQPRLDRIRISLEGEDLENGTLALAQGVSLLSGVRKALLASASTVRHARRYHPRMSFSEAELFVQSCRLGQTEVGSYVLTVEAPHRLAANAATPDQAFGRQASAILMRAVQSIVVNVRKGDAQPLLEDPSPIVSANLCDALVDMMPADEKADLRFRATWSPLLPISEGVPNQVHVDLSMYESIERLGEQLRPATGPTQDRFVASVLELSGQPGTGGEVEGDVTLQVRLAVDDGAAFKARVALSAAQYRVAVQAHMAARLVIVKGTLLRAGRGVAALSDIEEFTALEPG